MTEIEQPLTFGQKAVASHPTDNPQVLDLISKTRELLSTPIDLMNEVRKSSGRDDYPLGESGERAALSTIAIRKLQDAATAMVKAITWKD